MPTSSSSVVLINPSAGNPAVTMAVGVLQSGNGFGGAFVLDLGPTAYTQAAMSTLITGAPASCTVQLQGSVDGVNWTTVATSTSTTGDTQQIASSSTAQFNCLRVNVSAVSGGTSPTIAVTVTAFAGAQSSGSGGGTVNQGTGSSTSPWRVSVTPLAASAAGAGTTGAAPTGGTSITQAVAAKTGMYEVVFAGGFGTVTETVQLDNIGVKVNATFVTAIPLANLINTMSQPYRIYLSLTATDTVAVYVINNSSALSIYKGYISLTQVA